MKLTLDGIKDRQAWENAGIKLPGYDVEAVSKKAKEAPGWVHFGIGNIFRVFIGGIADGLLEEGVLDRGITCVETFDYDVIDKIYKPYDNLSLSVILHSGFHGQVLQTRRETAGVCTDDDRRMEETRFCGSGFYGLCE